MKAKTMMRICVLVIVLSVSGLAIASANYTINVEFPYRKAIGAYIDNAYDSATFEVMALNLNRTIRGMEDQGLVDADCARAWPWEQTPDMCMAYQYQYLRSLVNSTVTQYIYFENLKKSGQLIDPSKYNDAMNKQRSEFGRNGPVDWVAWPAWLLKYHSFYYWNWQNLLFIPLFVAILALLIVARRWAEERRERQWEATRERKRPDREKEP